MPTTATQTKARPAKQGTLTAIFAYGTLKPGFVWYHRLVAGQGCKVTGPAATVDPHTMVVDGIPYLIEGGEKGVPVKGVVLQVTDAVLASIDRLEGHPNWYQRKQIKVTLGRDGSTAEVWCYLLQRDADRWLQKIAAGEIQPVDEYDNPNYRGSD